INQTKDTKVTKDTEAKALRSYSSVMLGFLRFVSSAPFVSLCPFPPARPLPPFLLELRRRLAAARPAFAFTHPFEDLDQSQIDLAHLHVDPDHLHLDLVAEAIHLVRVLAAKQVRAFDEPVVVVGHRRHMHETF